MATFNLEKGSKFSIDKGIARVLVGLGWDEAKVAPPIDVDAHAFGCVHTAQGTPVFYNDASHVVSYANKANLEKGAAKSFGTKDGSITHTGDNLTGAGEGDDESIAINLELLPDEIVEVCIFLTIHDAIKRKQNFGQISKAYVHLVDQDSNAELCRYDLKNEFASAITIQVGSLVKENGSWNFKAVGAGTDTQGLMEVLEQLS